MAVRKTTLWRWAWCVACWRDDIWTTPPFVSWFGFFHCLAANLYRAFYARYAPCLVNFAHSPVPTRYRPHILCASTTMFFLRFNAVDVCFCHYAYLQFPTPRSDHDALLQRTDVAFRHLPPARSLLVTRLVVSQRVDVRCCLVFSTFAHSTFYLLYLPWPGRHTFILVGHCFPTPGRSPCVPILFLLPLYLQVPAP